MKEEIVKSKTVSQTFRYQIGGQALALYPQLNAINLKLSLNPETGLFALINTENCFLTDAQRTDFFLLHSKDPQLGSNKYTDEYVKQNEGSPKTHKELNDEAIFDLIPDQQKLEEYQRIWDQFAVQIPNKIFATPYDKGMSGVVLKQPEQTVIIETLKDQKRFFEVYSTGLALVNGKAFHKTNISGTIKTVWQVQDEAMLLHSIECSNQLLYQMMQGYFEPSEYDITRAEAEEELSSLNSEILNQKQLKPALASAAKEVALALQEKQPTATIDELKTMTSVAKAVTTGLTTSNLDNYAQCDSLLKEEIPGKRSWGKIAGALALFTATLGVVVGVSLVATGVFALPGLVLTAGSGAYLGTVIAAAAATAAASTSATALAYQGREQGVKAAFRKFTGVLFKESRGVSDKENKKAAVDKPSRLEI